MARAATKRGNRPRRNAPQRRRGGGADHSARIAEDTLFFGKLRTRGKWFFIFTSIVMVIGFAALGVGSGTGALQDLFNNLHIGGGKKTSVQAAQKDVNQHPNSPPAYKKLADAYENSGDADGAITALKRYVQLRPKDGDTIARLAGIQLAKADNLRQQASSLQYLQQQASGGQTFGPNPATKLGQALGADPIASAQTSQVSTQANDVYSRMSTAYADSVATYKQLVVLRPTDPTVQFQLAQAAESAGDIPTAVKAYKRFVKLDPTNPIAPQIKARILQLQPPAKKKKGAAGKKGAGG